MTDEELMRALYAEGITTLVIAEKFEISVDEVHEVLGLKRPNPRSVRVYLRFWNVMGERVMSSLEIAAAARMPKHYVHNYMAKLEERGQAKRMGEIGSRRGNPTLLWQMVRIEEWIPREPEGAAA